MAGGLAFAAPFAALAASPKPDPGDGEAAAGHRPARVVRQVTRRIVIVHPAESAPDVTFVPAPGGSAPSAPAPSAPVPSAPAAPPASSTGGS